MEKNRFLKILCYGTYVVGFQTMVIMDLWGMAFHAMVVIGLIPALLFISTWACCVALAGKQRSTVNSPNSNHIMLFIEIGADDKILLPRKILQSLLVFAPCVHCYLQGQPT